MTDESFELHPIGGLGRIGANMMLVRSGADSIIIDCGILFPKDDHFGVNYLIPDFYHIIKEHNIRAILITHGHEDHIGALSMLVKEIENVEIYAPNFAATLIRKKLSSDKVIAKVNVYNQNTILDFNTFNAIPTKVNHSIPDTYGIVFIDKKNEYALGYFSDFKIDPLATYETPMDLDALANILNTAKSKVLLTDSTSILSNKRPVSETELSADFDKIFLESKKRIFVTCFASNIFRIQTIINSAVNANRLVVPYGRSMNFYINAALDLKILEDPHSILRDVKAVDVNSDRLVVLLSGCQGEFRGTMRRVALGEDSTFKITNEDNFIFSSKTIPGNEKNISQILNNLALNNISTITASDALIHASGHITKEGLINLYDKIKPDFIIPIHGETHFLRNHLKIINENSTAKGIFLTNNDRIKFYNGKKFTVKMLDEYDPLMIHGESTILEKNALSERRKLAESGIIFISINIESVAKRRPKLAINHIGLPEKAVTYIDELHNFLLRKLKDTKILSREKEQEELRVAIRRYFIPHIGYRPLAIIQFV